MGPLIYHIAHSHLSPCLHGCLQSLSPLVCSNSAFLGGRPYREAGLPCSLGAAILELIGKRANIQCVPRHLPVQAGWTGAVKRR